MRRDDASQDFGLRDEDPVEPWHVHWHALRRLVMRVVLVLVVSFLVCWWRAEDLYAWLIAPITPWLNHGSSVMVPHVAGAFMTYLHVAWVAASTITVPYAVVDVYGFVRRGLTPAERRCCWIYAWASLVFFVLGAGICYFWLLPKACGFFIGVAQSGSIPLLVLPDMGQAASFVLQCCLAFGVCFQLPVIVMGLGHIGWVRASDLRRFRRMAIVACFVIGAVVTPPDIISQLVLALPLWGFYEVSVVLVGYLERRGRAAEEEKHA